MCSMAAFAIVIRPRWEVDTACTSGWTSPGRSGLREEQLRPRLAERDPGTPKACLQRKRDELLVGVEVAARGQWIRRSRRSLRLGRGRVDRDAAELGIEHAPHLAQGEHRVGEEEERNEAGHGGEPAVAEGQGLRPAADGERRREPHHVAAVVDARDLAADLLLHMAQKDAAAAAHVEQAVVRAERERLEDVRPREVVRCRRAVRLPGLLAVRAPGDAVGHAIDPPFADAIAEAQTAFCTLPALRQRVQTYARVAFPFNTMRTRWRFGSKRRFVATIEWLRWFPKPGFLPQIEQTFAIGAPV